FAVAKVVAGEAPCRDSNYLHHQRCSRADVGSTADPHALRGICGRRLDLGGTRPFTLGSEYRPTLRSGALDCALVAEAATDSFYTRTLVSSAPGTRREQRIH